jgi:primase-polymerase (primpol)-like protein
MVGENIPLEMRNLRQWIVWRSEERDGKTTKVPYCVNGYKKASTTNPQDWDSFNNVMSALTNPKDRPFSGVAFIFTREAGLVGIDLDHCRNAETGEIEPWAQAIVQELNSYTELSPSETGLHIIVRAVLPEGGNRKGRVEMYSWGKSFATTGLRYEKSSPSVETRDIADLHARMLRGELDPAPPVYAQGKYAGASTTGVIRPDGTVDESALDFKMVANTAKKLKTRDAEAIEAEVRRQDVERFERRERVKGSRGDQSYWEFTISRYLKKTNGANDVKQRLSRKQFENARNSYGL